MLNYIQVKRAVDFKFFHKFSRDNWENFSTDSDSQSSPLPDTMKYFLWNQHIFESKIKFFLWGDSIVVLQFILNSDWFVFLIFSIKWCFLFLRRCSHVVFLGLFSFFFKCRLTPENFQARQFNKYKLLNWNQTKLELSISNELIIWEIDYW